MRELKLSKYDKQFVLSLQLADVFLRDTIEKIEKTKQYKKAIPKSLIELEEKLKKASETVTFYADELIEKLNDNERNKRIACLDNVIDNIVAEVTKDYSEIKNIANNNLKAEYETLRKENEQLKQEKLIYKDLFQCLELAYNEIKDRKGKTENGTFIKNI